MTPDLRVNVAGVEFANPVMTASGCCGYGEELAELYSLAKLGALVTKSITLKPRDGHPPPRTCEVTAGMINAIGLANVGIDAFVADKLPWLSTQKTKVIVNVAGSTLAEYVEVCARLNDRPGVDMIELNISCPNVDKGGIEFGVDPQMTEKSLAAVTKVFSKPVIAKLGPNVTDIVAIAQAAEQGGARALSIMNSIYGMAIDINTWRPRITNNKGGLTGPAIKPVALALINNVHVRCDLPIIGIGGITTWQDAVEFLLCGATAIQVGTALFVEPDAPLKIVAGLTQYLRERRLGAVTELIGKVRKY